MKSDSGSCKLLAIGAHPDDLEFGMGGILLKEYAQGCEITLAITSRGESGSSGTSAQRELEALSAAGQLGAAERLNYLDFGGDGQQVASPDNALQIARIIRDVRPSMVFAPIPLPNQHPDHIAVGTATRNACRQARYGGLGPLKDLAPHAVDSLWFYSLSTTTDASLSSAVLIDVSDVVESWKALMACHQSQVSNLDYLDLQLSRARHLGLTAGCDYASPLWPNDPPVLQHIHGLTQTARGF